MDDLTSKQNTSSTTFKLTGTMQLSKSQIGLTFVKIDCMRHNQYFAFWIILSHL